MTGAARRPAAINTSTGRPLRAKGSLNGGTKRGSNHRDISGDGGDVRQIRPENGVSPSRRQGKIADGHGLLMKKMDAAHRPPSPFREEMGGGLAALHVDVVRPAAAFRRGPVDVLVRVLD